MQTYLDEMFYEEIKLTFSLLNVSLKSADFLKHRKQTPHHSPPQGMDI